MGVPGIGDFIAIGKLAWDLYHKCYLVAKDAPKEFRELIDELGALHKALERLERDVQNPESQLNRAGPERLNTLSDVIDGTRYTLTELQKLVDKYHKKLAADNSGKGRLRAGGNAFWGRFKWSMEKGAVTDFQSRILRDTARINLMMTAIGNSSLERLEGMVERLLSAGRKEENITEEAPASETVEPQPTSVSADVGSAVVSGEVQAANPVAVNDEDEGSSDEEEEEPYYITLIDCFHREHTVRMDFCQTWRQIESYVMDLMKEETIFDEIKVGNYNLYGPNRLLLKPSTWQTTIKPGWKVTMALKPRKKLIGHKLVATFEQDSSATARGSGAFRPLAHSRTESEGSLSNLTNMYEKMLSRRDSDATLVNQDISRPLSTPGLYRHSPAYSRIPTTGMEDFTNGKQKLQQTSIYPAPTKPPPSTKSAASTTAGISKYKDVVGFDVFCAKKLPPQRLKVHLPLEHEEKLFKIWTRASQKEKTACIEESLKLRAPKLQYIASTGSETDIRIYYQNSNGDIHEKQFSDTIELASIFEGDGIIFKPDTQLERRKCKQESPLTAVRFLAQDGSGMVESIYLFMLDSSNHIRWMHYHDGKWSSPSEPTDNSNIHPSSDLEAVTFGDSICLFYQHSSGRVLCKLFRRDWVSHKLESEDASVDEVIISAERAMVGSPLSAVTFEGLDGQDRRKRIVLYYQAPDFRVVARSLAPVQQLQAVKAGAHGAVGKSKITVAVIKEKTAEEEKMLSPPSMVREYGKFCACVSGDLTIRVFCVNQLNQLVEWRRLPSGSWRPKNTGATVYDGSRVASAAWEDQVRVWYQKQPDFVSERLLDHDHWQDGGTVGLFDSNEGNSLEAEGNPMEGMIPAKVASSGGVEEEDVSKLKARAQATMAIGPAMEVGGPLQ